MLKYWILAARPKTLTAALIPVLTATALAYSEGKGAWLPALLCCLFAAIMQIAANFINDLFDYKKGTDREDRLGPKRACAQGWISPKAMQRGIIITLALACVIGCCLLPFGGWALIGIGGGTTYYSNELSNENLFRIQSEAIRKAAADHSCIFIGRCADYVLRDYPRCVNVFITADMKDRIANVMKWSNCSAEKAEEIIEKGDSQRADFYNFYSSGTWGAASTYHLCINSSVLGIEATAAFIKEFILKKLGEK